MKKITIIAFSFVFILIGCKNSSVDVTSLSDNDSINKNTVASEENVPVKEGDKICNWIDDSDIVIKLDLPEEYAHYDDATIFPSYEVGFMFKSSHGEIASSRRLARKNCDYRVGFSKDDFTNINSNPNYPLIIYAQKDSSTDFSYDSEPIKITLKDGLPEQGDEFVVKINGKTPSFRHYDEVFK